VNQYPICRGISFITVFLEAARRQVPAEESSQRSNATIQTGSTARSFSSGTIKLVYRNNFTLLFFILSFLAFVFLFVILIFFVRG
jgi:hypothetical protein